MVKYKRKSLALQYECRSLDEMEGSVLLSESITPGHIWRAKKITYISNRLENKVVEIRDVAIKTVWQ
ncbi:MAG: hypothetical protein LBL17_02845 [Coxiellaceae bacterium]|nr:hypothetical protein [Coxiellaceae bacterium]